MTPKIGEGCTFYHEGGVGERRWVAGWRYGIVREKPKSRKNFIRVEIPVRRYTWNDEAKAWEPRVNDRAWVFHQNVNTAGDYTFHGNETIVEDVRERAETKAKQIAQTAKRVDKLTKAKPASAPKPAPPPKPEKKAPAKAKAKTKSKK